MTEAKKSKIVYLEPPSRADDQVVDAYSKIVFLEPPSRTKNSLDDQVVDAYYQKICPFQIWEPHYLRVGNEISLYTEIGAEPQRMSVEKYNQLVKTKPLKKSFRYLFEKASLHVAYLWEAESKRIPDSQLDDIDRSFIEKADEMEGCAKHELFGYHTYGGYYGFFRPDLYEVIHMVATIVPFQKLSSVKRIYVTTDMYPSDKIWDCYDSKKDMHKAKTTCYVVY